MPSPLPSPSTCARAVLAASLAMLSGCGTRPDDAEKPFVGGLGVSARVEGSDDAPGLVFRSDRWGASRPVARLDGVRLVLGGGPGGTEVTHDLVFEAFDQGTDSLSAVCSTIENHAIRLEVRPTSVPGRLAITVEDRVAVRTEVLELSVRYRVLGGRAADEVWAPLALRGDEAIAGDRCWHVPMAYARAGGLACSVHPDVDLLTRERPIPQGLGVRRDPAIVEHGLFAYREVQDENGAVRHERRGYPIAVRGETLRFAHELRIYDDESATDHLRQVLGDVWTEGPAWLLANSSAPLTAAAGPLCAAALEPTLAMAVRSETDRGTVTALDSSGSAKAGFAQSWFTVDRQALHTALGWTYLGDAGRQRAAELVRLLIEAPGRGGWFPASIALDSASGTRRTLPTTGHPFDRPDCHRTAHLGRTGFELLQLRKRLPRLADRIQTRCATTVRFLKANQRSSGAFPPWFDLAYQAPVGDPERSPALDAAPAALFLAEWAQQVGDADAWHACRRYLRFVEARGCISGVRGDNRVSQLSDGVSRNGPAPAGSTGLVFAARAALRLASHNAPEFAAEDRLRAERMLAALALFQATSIDDIDPAPTAALPGAFVRTNLERSVTDPITGIAGLALLEGHDLTRDRALLERGTMALRAGLFAAGSDPSWGRATGATCMLEALERWGPMIVNPAQGLAVGLDAIWVPSAVAASQGTLDLEVFRQFDDGSVKAVVVDADTATDWTLGAATETPAPANGLAVPTVRVSPIAFQPPGEIAIGTPWYPALEVAEPAHSGEVWVEVRRSGGPPVRLPVDPTSPRTRTTEPFFPVDLSVGDVIEARAVQRIGGSYTRALTRGWHRVVVTEQRCIDPGDDLEWSMVSGQDAPRERFATGREWCRVLQPDAGITYALPIDPQAAELDLTITVRGGIRIRAGDRILHEDDAPTDAVRELPLELSDRRLWARGTLELAFESVANERRAQLARIRYLTQGEGARVDGTARQVAASPPSHLRVLVLPVQLVDAPLTHGPATIERVFFGGIDYRITAEPESRRTSGSVASQVAALSGGVTGCIGTVAPPSEPTILAVDVEKDLAAGAVRLVEQAVAACSEPVRTDAFDVVVVMHGPRPRLQPLHSLVLPADGQRPPVVFLPDRSADGSIVASGAALVAVIRGIYDLEDLGPQEAGGFGDLSATAKNRGHIPGGLIGDELARIGWADAILPPLKRTQSLEIPALYRDRAFVVLADRIGRGGELHIEEHQNSAAEPGLPASGVLIYWRLRRGTEPVVVLPNGSRVEPRRLRLAPGRSIVDTAFEEARAEADLFTESATLDGTSTPVLATPDGLVPWRIDDLHRREDGRFTGLVEALDQPLHARSWTWSGGPATDLRELDPWSSQPSRGSKVRRLDSDIQIMPEPGELVQGRVVVQDRSIRTRVFGKAFAAQGQGILHLGVDDREFWRAPFESGDTLACELDLPAGKTLWLAVENTGDERAIVAVRSIVAIPRQPMLDGLVPATEEPLARQLGPVWRSVVRTVTSGGRRQRTPISLPAGARTLRLRVLGTAPGITGSFRLTSLDGTYRHELLAGEPMPSTSQPRTILVRLPEDAPDVAMIEFEAKGPKDSQLLVLSAEVTR